MPHASGGGSFGGGFYGGPLHSINGRRYRYLPGSKIRLDDPNNGTDNYINALSKAKKAFRNSMIATTIIAVLVIGLLILGTSPYMAVTAISAYPYKPVINDDAGVIKNSGDLEKAMNDYSSLTGICPVIYTVYEESWKDNYHGVLEDYALNRYLQNFSDESRFVIVLSVPESEAKAFSEGSGQITNFKLGAAQGNYTDRLLTTSVYNRFKKVFENDIKKGYLGEDALEHAFKFAYDNAYNKINPSAARQVLNLLIAYHPLVIAIVVFAIVYIVMIRRFIKEKKAGCEVVQRSDPRFA